MYTVRNFKTKKALREAVDAWNKRETDPHAPGQFGQIRAVTYYQPGPFGGNEPRDGEFSVEGPHYPEPHRWYARVVACDGVIVKVK